MTAQEIAEHISKLPAGAKVTVVFEVTDGAPTLQTDASANSVARDADPLRQTVPATPAARPSIKLQEAKGRFGIPLRELQRAVKDGFLASTPKTNGKDAGAHLVRPDDVETYREKRESILSGEDPVPENWPGPKPKARWGEAG